MLRRCVLVWGWVILLIAARTLMHCDRVLLCHVHRDAAGTPCVFSERASRMLNSLPSSCGGVTGAKATAAALQWRLADAEHCRDPSQPHTLRNSTVGVLGHGAANHETARLLAAACVATNITCRGPKLSHMCTRTTPEIPSTKQSRLS